MKYIIEFHDEPELMEEGLSYYTCVDAPWWSASWEGERCRWIVSDIRKNGN
jgi:hypothetical protein